MSSKFLADMRECVGSEDFKELSKEEQQRAEDKLTPFISEITSEIEGFRDILDGIIQKRRKKLRGKIDPHSFLGKYPIGQCKEIRDEVFTLMQLNNRKPDFPGLQAIRRYDKTGNAVMKKVWGIQDDNNFQNAIQVGGYCIDAALDTVNTPEPKVAVRRIEDCGIRNIKDFTDYARIAEKYWGYDVYPNIYLPHLAPLFPSIMIDSEDGSILFDGGGASVMGRNVTSQGEDLPLFQNTLDFTTKGHFSHKRLPDEYVARLGHLFNILRYDGSGIIRSLCDFEENGSPLMTEAAIHQRVEDGNFDEYYSLAYHGLGKPINEKRLKPKS